MMEEKQFNPFSEANDITYDEMLSYFDAYRLNYPPEIYLLISNEKWKGDRICILTDGDKVEFKTAPKYKIRLYTSTELIRDLADVSDEKDEIRLFVSNGISSPAKEAVCRKLDEKYFHAGTICSK